MPNPFAVASTLFNQPRFGLVNESRVSNSATTPSPGTMSLLVGDKVMPGMSLFIDT